jgi:3-(3-hydroxy-phenyl)propionate hydroxylase
MGCEERIFIAGAGPVGLVAAAALVRRGLPVTVFEAETALGTESRASTFHPPTLDMLDDLGLAADLIAQGLRAPKLQYRSKRDGILGEFDFGAIADATRHPFRVQAEQAKLTRIILGKLRSHPLFEIQFGSRVRGVTQDSDGVALHLVHASGLSERRGRWLIGTDGARSAVRAALDIGFEGFTWPERFLVLTTMFDFDTVLSGLVDVTYVADPDRWHFLLRIPGAWRVMFPVPAEVDDATATSDSYVQAALATVAPPGTRRYEVEHTTLYRVHQRVAETYRKGRAFLAGDAAHINNPLGGMGMNGGIHDVVDLAGRLDAVWRGAAPDGTLDRYDRQRRGVTLEHVQTASIQNKRNLEARDEADRARFRDEMRRTMEDPALTRAMLLRVSMIASLRRAEELGAIGGSE